MPDRWIETFLAADPEERLALARRAEHEEELRRWFGDPAWEEYRRLAGRTGERHLSLRAPKNLIFVPGVMGSLLRSEGLGGVWWIDARTRNHLDDLRLSPDGSADAEPGHQIGPFSTDPSYEPFLSAVLARDDFGHVLFPYDWRKPLARSTALLARRIEDLYGDNGGEKVHLVAHSMGGLLVRATLLEHGDALGPKLGRVVFVGTPHFGSPAIVGYLKNHLWGFDVLALLGRYLSRDTFRSLWGVLGLLPAPRGIYPDTHEDDPADVHPCANFDLYRAESWKLGLEPDRSRELQAVLNGAADFHRWLDAGHRALPPQRREPMLMVAGVGYKTLFRLAYEKDFGWEHMKKVTRRVPGDPHREGDGRVPLASATLDGVETRYVKGVHGGLTNIPEVWEDVFRWLREEPLKLPETPEEALARHLAPGEGESEAPHLDGTAGAARESDDPGYWDLDPPAGELLSALEARLDEERLPEFHRVRLL